MGGKEKKSLSEMSRKVKSFSEFVNEDNIGGLKSIFNFFSKGKTSDPDTETSSKPSTSTTPGTTSTTGVTADDGKPLDSPLGKSFLEVILPTVGAKEIPTKSNSGPEVNKFLSKTGLSPRNQWCMAYIYSTFGDIFKKIGKPNILKKTGAVIDSWKSAPSSNKITIERARSTPSLVKPGMVFYADGHAGIVLSIDDKTKEFKTIEGNYSDKVSKVKRNLSENDLLGFVDFFSNLRNSETDSDLASAGTQIYGAKA